MHKRVNGASRNDFTATLEVSGAVATDTTNDVYQKDAENVLLILDTLPSGTLDRVLYALLKREHRSYEGRPDGASKANKLLSVLGIYQERLGE